MASKDKSKEDVQQAPVSAATNLSAQIASNFVAFRVTNDEAYLERSQTLVKHAMPDIAEHLAKNAKLLTLMYADGKLRHKDCKPALAEIKMWPWVYKAVGDTTVLCHIIKSYRTHKEEMPRGRLAVYMTYEMIGKSALEETAEMLGPMSEPMIDYTETAASVTTFGSVANDLERMIKTRERYIMAAQESQSSTGVVVGSMAEAWNRYGSAVDNDQAKLLATTIHTLALDEICGQEKNTIAFAQELVAFYRELAVKRLAVQENTETSADESEDESEDEGEDEGEEPRE